MNNQSKNIPRKIKLILFFSFMLYIMIGLLFSKFDREILLYRLNIKENNIIYEYTSKATNLNSIIVALFDDDTKLALISTKAKSLILFPNIYSIVNRQYIDLENIYYTYGDIGEYSNENGLLFLYSYIDSYENATFKTAYIYCGLLTKDVFWTEKADFLYPLNSDSMFFVSHTNNIFNNLSPMPFY